MLNWMPLMVLDRIPKGTLSQQACWSGKGAEEPFAKTAGRYLRSPQRPLECSGLHQATHACGCCPDDGAQTDRPVYSVRMTPIPFAN